MAALTHYFLLAAMAWMSVEAFYMYIAIVRVFHTYYSKFLLKCCLIGWGKIQNCFNLMPCGLSRTVSIGWSLPARKCYPIQMSKTIILARLQEGLVILDSNWHKGGQVPAVLNTLVAGNDGLQHC